MGYRGEPAADFAAFVERHVARVYAAARAVTGDDWLAEELVVEVFGEVARRWALLRGPAHAEAAEAYLRRVYEQDAPGYADGWTPRAELRLPAWTQRAWYPPMPGSPSTAGVVDRAWTRAGGSRHRRRVILAGGLVAVAAAVFVRPERPGAALTVGPDEPDVPAPTGDADGVTVVDVLPAQVRRASLPWRRTVLPRAISPDSSRGPLTRYPVRRATAVFALLSGQLLVLGDDGRVREAPPGVLYGPDAARGGCRLTATSLAPDGLRAAFPGDGQVAILDMRSGQLRRYAAPPRSTAAVWLDRAALVVGGPDGSVWLDVATGATRPTPVQAGDALTAQANAAPARASSDGRRPVLAGLIELLAAEPGSLPARVRRHLPSSSGDQIQDTVVSGRGLQTIGAWLGAGFRTGDWAAQDCQLIDRVPDGQATLATAALDPSTGRVTRLLVARTEDSAGTPQLLGWLDRRTALIRARGSGVDLLAWDLVNGEFRLVARMTERGAVSFADLSRLL